LGTTPQSAKFWAFLFGIIT